MGCPVSSETACSDSARRGVRSGTEVVHEQVQDPRQTPQDSCGAPPRDPLHPRTRPPYPRDVTSLSA
eukprot:1895879-Rhodomonas_salina.1